MMEGDLLEKLIEFLEGASPVVWGAAVRQVQINAAMHFFWAVCCALVLVACLLVLRWAILKDREVNNNDTAGRWRNDDYEIPIIFSAVGAAIFLFFTALLVSFGLAIVANPEYYAIRELVGLAGLS
jgi:hypothetical protein